MSPLQIPHPWVHGTQVEHGHPASAGDVAPAAPSRASRAEPRSPGAQHSGGADHVPLVSAVVTCAKLCSPLLADACGWEEGCTCSQSPFELFIPLLLIKALPAV